MARAPIMLIRHGEKPESHDSGLGVGAAGKHSTRDLVVRGWQRAGALARFFAPVDGRFSHPALVRPERIFAAGTAPGSRSRRSRETVTPLADLLGIEVVDSFTAGEEPALAAALLGGEGAALVAWEHKAIAAIVTAVTAGGVTPPDWPRERYDMVLVLHPAGPGWTLTQVPQLLLAGDRSDPL